MSSCSNTDEFHETVMVGKVNVWDEVVGELRGGVLWKGSGSAGLDGRPSRRRGGIKLNHYYSYSISSLLTPGTNENPIPAHMATKPPSSTTKPYQATMAEGRGKQSRNHPVRI